MKNRPITLLLLVTPLLFSACAHRIVGSWNVARFETATPGQESVVLSNVGMMKFYRDGTGEKKLDYAVLGVRRNDEIPFKWIWSEDKYISIESEGSDFAKTWIIIENKRKYQKWKTTNGASTVQVLELRK